MTALQHDTGDNLTGNNDTGHRLVLLRHGESAWNKENRFTGWTDVDLTDKGIQEAHEGAKLLADRGYRFDIAFTSYQKRAIRTLWLVLDDMGLMWIPVHRSWRLNERHYGALQGLSKAEMAAKYGEEQVHIWRRSYDVPPPALTPEDERWPGNDPMYQEVTKEQLPLTECLKDTVARVQPYWEQSIAPVVRDGKRVLVAAHGNSLRALVKLIEGMPDDEIVEFNIPTGVPLVLHLDAELRFIRREFLLDDAALAERIAAVKNQGKAK